MKALAKITHQQSVEAIFAQELEQVYFPGYIEQMNETNPEKIEWELKEFQSQFSKKN
jgi:hypothetical protein